MVQISKSNQLLYHNLTLAHTGSRHGDMRIPGKLYSSASLCLAFLLVYIYDSPFITTWVPRNELLKIVSSGFLIFNVWLGWKALTIDPRPGRKWSGAFFSRLPVSCIAPSRLHLWNSPPSTAVPIALWASESAPSLASSGLRVVLASQCC